jgi:hypothetical protein
MSGPSSFGGNLLLYAAFAVVAWLAWPTIKHAIGPDTGSYDNPEPYGRPSRRAGRAFQMRLDPNEVSPNVEDRRGGHGNIRVPGGGDLETQIGVPDVQHRRADRGDGQIIGCLDQKTGRRVDPRLCERERGAQADRPEFEWRNHPTDWRRVGGVEPTDYFHFHDIGL